MFERIARGWRLGMTALGVIRSDKKLLVFPLLSGLALLFVTLSFALPFVFSQSLQSLLDTEAQGDQVTKQKIILLPILFAFYFCNYFVIVFFNSALISCAIMRFNGMEPTLGDGFRAACSRMPQILAWALVSATVGMILKLIESSSERFGQFIAGLLGLGWSILTFFVVPVLVVEKLGPIAAIKRSTSILRKTWGESIVANFGVGLVMLVLFVLAAIPAILGILVGKVAIILIGVGVTLVLWMILALVSTAANTIVLAAVYQYAAQDKVPQQFDGDTLRGAFTRK